jgi:hypothetical protein
MISAYSTTIMECILFIHPYYDCVLSFNLGVYLNQKVFLFVVQFPCLMPSTCIHLTSMTMHSTWTDSPLVQLPTAIWPQSGHKRQRRIVILEPASTKRLIKLIPQPPTAFPLLGVAHDDGGVVCSVRLAIHQQATLARVESIKP